jgi:sec-independent protein translocase protein TatA
MITGWEWIVILLVVVAFMLWGPQKIPELARAIGRARGEFERASREYSASPPPSAAKTTLSNDDMLIAIAKGLGIETEGKTRDEIFQKIIENIKASKSS